MEIVLYNKFSLNNIFDYAPLNTAMNQVYSFLINALPNTAPEAAIFIDGAVALSLQGESISQAPYILISINSLDLFQFASSSIHVLDIDSYSESDSYFDFGMLGYMIRIQYDENATGTLIKGQYVRNKHEIK